MRHLVVAHGNEPAVVHGHVSRLQQRIAEEAKRGKVLLDELLPLLLVRRHTLQPWNRNHHREQQVQLGMLRNERLDEDRAAIGIDATRDPVGDVVECVAGDPAGVRIVARERVPVGDEIEAVVLVLQRHPVLQRPEIIAEMQTAGWLHAGQDAVRTFVIGGRVTHGRALRESHQEGG